MPWCSTLWFVPFSLLLLLARSVAAAGGGLFVEAEAPDVRVAFELGGEAVVGFLRDISGFELFGGQRRGVRRSAWVGGDVGACGGVVEVAVAVAVGAPGRARRGGHRSGVLLRSSTLSALVCVCVC